MAANTDLFRAATNNFSTTLSGSIGVSDTTMTLASVTNLPTSTGIDLVIDRVSPSGTLTPSTREYVKGVVSGSNIISLVRGLGNSTAQSHSTGAVVEMVPTGETQTDMVTGLVAQHNQDGTHNTTYVVTPTATQALTHKTITDTSNSVSSATLTNPYKFSVYRAAALNTSAATWALVTFDTETYDTGSNYSVSTGKFTAPVAGFYRFDATLTLASANGNTSFGTQLWKNGSSVGQLNFENITAYTAGNLTRSGGTELQLAANDYIQVYTYCNGTVALGVGANLSSFQGFLVSNT